MSPSAVNPFEYVSILVSIILGLGITQLLASFSDLLYHFRKVRFYWPHVLWVVFVLFLHIQDWFITYQLKTKVTWDLPDLFFVLIYPIALFCVAKMLMPTNDSEERTDMKRFYYSQFPVIGVLILICIGYSILFNFLYLQVTVSEQVPLLIFFGIMVYMVAGKPRSERVHQVLAVGVFLASFVSVLLTRDVWIIR